MSHKADRRRPGRLRIGAGRLRGSRIEVPDRPGLRPTPDRVRETLFNWLAPVIEGARCLDLFAGTGALGIEALSRGAAHCTFVERDRELARAIAATLARLGVAGGEVVAADALSWLQQGAQPADVVFLDPPFGEDLWQPALTLLAARGWLRPAGFVYVEAPRGGALPQPPGFQLHREAEAGEVRYGLIRGLVDRLPS